MSQQQAQTVQVIQKNEGCFSGCGTLFAVLLVIALAVEYWYAAVPLAVVLLGVGAYVWHKKQQQLPPPQPGRLDPWLNRIATTMSSHGYWEKTRNTGSELEGSHLDGDLCLEGDGMRIWVNVFGDAYAANQVALVKPQHP